MSRSKCRLRDGLGGGVVAALAVAAAGLSGCSDTDGPVWLVEEGVIDLSPGYARSSPAVYEHTLKTRDVSHVPIAGTMSVTAEVVRRFETEALEARDDGTALVAMRMRAVRFHIEPPQQPVYDFDSESNPGEEDDRIAEALRGLAELSFQAEMDARGKVVELVGFVEALEQLRQPPERVISLFDRAWFISALETVWAAAEEDLQRQIGETWVQSVDSTIPEGTAQATTDVTHTLSGVEGSMATIEGTGEMRIRWGMDPLTRGTKSRIEDQSFEFTTLWNLEEGSLESQTVDSMIKYFVNHGGGLDQQVERYVDAVVKRTPPSQPVESSPE